MPAKKKSRVTESHRFMFVCVGKITAYRKVGNIVEAKAWGVLLQKHLREEGLLCDTSPT